MASGYTPGRYNSLTGAYTVRLQDAHAWVEIRFREYGWVPFDATPRPDSPWALDTGARETTRGVQLALRQSLKAAAVDTPAAAVQSAGRALGNANWVNILAGVAVLALGGVIVFLLARSRLRRGPGLRSGLRGYTLLDGPERDEVRGAFLEAQARLRALGYPARRVSQSPGEFILALGASGLVTSDALNTLARLADHALYDPAAMPDDSSGQARACLRELRTLPPLLTTGTPRKKPVLSFTRHGS